jgi:mRNA-degrading endonuclease RelE of RelBE toxin-antitoxin system
VSRRKKCKKVVKKVLEKLSESCQKVVRKLSKSCQKVVKKLSKSFQEIAKKLSKNVTKLSKSCQKIVKKLSKCYLVKICDNCIPIKFGGWEGVQKVIPRPLADYFVVCPKAKSKQLGARHDDSRIRKKGPIRK